MTLTDYVNTFGRYAYRRFGARVHKIALDAGFTCPNRDGSKGIGGCTFCNNASFSPNARNAVPLAQQLENGRQALAKPRRNALLIAYFQAYTNTYGGVDALAARYDEALNVPGVVGLSVGTRPDCISGEVLALLASYRARGLEVWLELGLQSAFDDTLTRVNRGHSFDDYRHAIAAAHAYGIPVCTHLILGLPGEALAQWRQSLQAVIALGVQGLKLHALHVVKGTQLANQWRRGEYQPLGMEEYAHGVADLVAATPGHVVFHRLTGTAPPRLLLDPAWCADRWPVLNAIEAQLRQRGLRQGESVMETCA